MIGHSSTTRLLLAIRLEGGALDARERRRLVEDVAQPHEQIKARLRPAQVRGRNGEFSEGLYHVRVEGGVRHAQQVSELSGIDPRTLQGEASREGLR